MVDRPEGFWDQRYSEVGFAYGDEPNDFVRECEPRIPAGRVLCLAEGQGRNAVFLSGHGYEVTAMDQSPVGMARAAELARARGVALTTVVAGLEDFAPAAGAWHGMVCTFAHLPPALRRRVHCSVVEGLAPGGVFVLEAYGPRQLEFRTGGPEDPERLAGVGTLCAELDGLDFEIAREVERDVIEGRYHTGRASTVQLLGRKPAG